jgi:hypothetical protein
LSRAVIDVLSAFLDDPTEDRYGLRLMCHDIAAERHAAVTPFAAPDVGTASSTYA